MRRLCGVGAAGDDDWGGWGGWGGSWNERVNVAAPAEAGKLSEVAVLVSLGVLGAPAATATRQRTKPGCRTGRAIVTATGSLVVIHRPGSAAIN